MTTTNSTGAQAIGDYCVAIGRGALAKGKYAVALGDDIENTTDYSVSHGKQLYFTSFYGGPNVEVELERLRAWWLGATEWKAEMEASLGEMLWCVAESWIHCFLELPERVIDDTIEPVNLD